MTTVGASFAHTVRIVHMALWLTLPASLWLWLLTAPAPQPRVCAPYCGWYGGNVLDVPAEEFFMIMVILLVVGVLVYVGWIAGYCLEITRRVVNGNRQLPPVRSAMIGVGWRLLLSSLRFWLPPFVAKLCLVILCGLMFPSQSGGTMISLLMLFIVSPAALAMLCGNIVGAARYAVRGDRSLICRRWENTRLALTNFIETLAFTSAQLVLLAVCATAISQVPVLLRALAVDDLYAQAAIASFATFVILLCASFFGSHLVALYAKSIGLRDIFMRGAAGNHQANARGNIC